MKYMILIHGSEEAWAALTPAEMEREMGAYFAYSQELAQAGKMVAGEELHPVATAKSLRVRDGKTHVIDGPYVDVKEQFGGFYLIDVANEAEALEWAAKCPGARHGGVEVRPCVNHGG
jgi:hypothetical protein